MRCNFGIFVICETYLWFRRVVSELAVPVKLPHSMHPRIHYLTGTWCAERGGTSNEKHEEQRTTSRRTNESFVNLLCRVIVTMGSWIKQRYIESTRLVLFRIYPLSLALVESSSSVLIHSNLSINPILPNTSKSTKTEKDDTLPILLAANTSYNTTRTDTPRVYLISHSFLLLWSHSWWESETCEGHERILVVWWS